MLDSSTKTRKPAWADAKVDEVENEALPPPVKFSKKFHHFAGHLQIECVDNIFPPEWLENGFNLKQSNDEVIGETVS